MSVKPQSCLDSLIILYEGRLKALESNTMAGGLTWAGAHEPGKSYRAGEFCKRNAGVWLCTKDTTSAPGLSPDAWELVVKGTDRP